MKVLIRGARTCVVGVVAATALLTAPDASGAAGPATPNEYALTEYAERTNVSTEVAAARLDLQSRGYDLVDVLSEQLGESFGGVWFDNEIGRFHVGTTSDAHRPGIEEVLSDRSLSRDTTIVTVQHSMADLDAATSKLTKSLDSWLEKGLIRIGTWADRNQVRVLISADAAPAERDQIREISDQLGDVVATSIVSAEHFAVGPAACTFPSCSQPLRGGVAIIGDTGCSAGFVGFIPSILGARVLFTAGHCITTTGATWTASYNNGASHSIGPALYKSYGANGDHGVIAVNGSGWSQLLYPWVAQWDGTPPGLINESRPVVNQASEWQGQWSCRYGKITGARCGYVLSLNNPITYPDGTRVEHLTESNACADVGDSGGPWMSYNDMALGIVSGSNFCSQTPNPVNWRLYTTPIAFPQVYYSTQLITNATGPK